MRERTPQFKKNLGYPAASGVERSSGIKYLMNGQIIGSRVFDAFGQQDFANWSGDRNPMHLDPVYARRTQAGDIVVHGMHAMLWALDLLARHGLLDPARCTLTARFEKFIYVGDEVSARLTTTGKRHAIELRTGGLRVATLSVLPVDARAASTLSAATTTPVPQEPAEWRLEELAGLTGSLVPAGTSETYIAAFPALAAWLGGETVRTLAALSTLVGMVCPGLHSIFSRLSVIVEPKETVAPLAYTVRRVQPVLRLATVDIDGGNVAGSIEAFVRHPPIRQPSLRELADRALPISCRGDVVLILGGSRGLGELTAKLLALAGAEVIITYARGHAEAAAVAEEIVAGGGRCTIMRYDADVPAQQQLGGVAGTVSHAYYFPTPQIFRTRGLAFDSEALARFTAIYSAAFADIATMLAYETRPVRLFYPSSAAIDDRPNGAAEYVMAKAAGEILCGYLNRSWNHIDIRHRRLPRLLTDQTSTVLPVATADAVAILSEVAIDLHATRHGDSEGGKLNRH